MAQVNPSSCLQRALNKIRNPEQNKTSSLGRCPSCASDLVQAGHYKALNTALNILCIGWIICSCVVGVELATLPERRIHKPRISPPELIERRL